MSYFLCNSEGTNDLSGEDSDPSRLAHLNWIKVNNI